MKEKETVSIAIAAKGLLKDPPEVTPYLRAVDRTVQEVMEAIQERIDRDVARKTQNPSGR